MKIKATIVLGCLVCMIVLFSAHEASPAKSIADNPKFKIGVVSVRKIFQNCERTAKYREEAVAERDKIEAQLDKLAEEFEAEKEGLRALKTGSSDHMALMKEVLTKQAILQSRQKFYEQQMSLKEQIMIEELYKDILKITGEVAQQKGMDMVFEKSEPELPAPSASELTMAISTHKLLYSGGCLDITDEVTARLDAGS